MDDDRLHDSLHRLADRSGEPDASSQSLVKRARLRLVRNIILALAGAVAISTMGIAAIGQLDRPSIPPSDTSPTPVTSSSPSPSVSPHPGRLLYVYSFQGDLYGAYNDGARRLLVQGTENKPIVNPTVSRDEEGVVYQLGEGRNVSLAYLSLQNGSQCCFRDGSYPTFGPRHLVARVVHAPGVGLAIAIGVPTSEAEHVYPVPSDLAGVRDLGFERSGEILTYRGIYKKGREPMINGEKFSDSIFVGDVLYGLHNVLKGRMPSDPAVPNNHQPGAAYWALSEGTSTNVLKVCCDARSGTYSHVELGEVDPIVEWGYPYRKIVNLDSLHIDLQTCRCFTAFGFHLAPSEDGSYLRWSKRAGRSWFVGDGVHLWWIRDDKAKTTLEMPFQVTGGLGVPNHLCCG